MKISYNGTEYDINKAESIEYVRSVFLSTIESRQGKADDDTRPARVAELLGNLSRGILPQRGSKGSTREPWESERTILLRAMLHDAGIEHSLKGDENLQAAIAKLASAKKRDVSEFSEMLEKRAIERYTLKTAPL